MGEHGGSIEELLRSTEVGGTIRMRIDPSQLNAEVPDRVSPSMSPPADPDGPPILQGVTKDARGLWDLESVTRPRDSSIVEIVIRRAASDP
jgi:hypothetical protein